MDFDPGTATVPFTAHNQNSAHMKWRTMECNHLHGRMTWRSTLFRGQGYRRQEDLPQGLRGHRHWRLEAVANSLQDDTADSLLRVLLVQSHPAEGTE